LVRLNPALAEAVTIQETAKSLTCPEPGTRYRALSADATTAYGLSPALVIHDELGQVRGPRSALYEALETATGVQQDPLSIIISTQAPTDADLLSILIDDAQAGHDPHTVLSLNTAPTDLDPFDEATIRRANPAFGTFHNAREVLAMAQDAKRMPARPGLDLSEVSDLTALVLIGWRDRKWRVQPTFWLPSEGLAEKATADQVPYDLWRAQGYFQVFKRYNVQKLAFDRWNMRHLLPWLLRAGFSEQLVLQV
jgi:phage terminase large subunit-like protein